VKNPEQSGLDALTGELAGDEAPTPAPSTAKLCHQACTIPPTSSPFARFANVSLPLDNRSRDDAERAKHEDESQHA
jgi:hypothetical protein